MSTNDGYICFLRNNFFSDIIFLSKFYSTEKRNKRLKLCKKKKKKIGHHTHLEENNLLTIWPTYPQRKPTGSDCACTRARANDERNYVQ